MPKLRGWMQDQEDPTAWTYGGQFFAACMIVRWHPPDTSLPVLVRIWPRLGEVGSNDPTQPLGWEHDALSFADEATARAYVESWERALRG